MLAPLALSPIPRPGKTLARVTRTRRVSCLDSTQSHIPAIYSLIVLSIISRVFRLDSIDPIYSSIAVGYYLRSLPMLSSKRESKRTATRAISLSPSLPSLSTAIFYLPHFAILLFPRLRLRRDSRPR